MSTHLKTNARLHYLDSVRSLLMLLGIPFHASLIYDATQAWSIKSGSSSDLIGAIGSLTTSFRMPAFFIVSGFFSYLTLARSPARQWLRTRYERLAIPLLAAALMLNPFQIMVTEASKPGVSEAEAINAIVQKLTTVGSHWLRHLWFLPTLLVLCTILGAVVHISRSHTVARRHPLLRFTRQPRMFFWLYVGSTGVFSWVLSAIQIDFPHWPLRYAPFFFLGVILASTTHLLDDFLKLNPVTLVLTLTLPVAFHFVRSDSSLIKDVIQSTCGILMAKSLLGVTYRYANKPMPLVRKVADASYSIYLAHQPVILVLGFFLLQFELNPLAGFGLICTLTFLLSYGFHLGVQRSSLLLFFFNGIFPQRSRTRRAETQSQRVSAS